MFGSKKRTGFFSLMNDDLPSVFRYHVLIELPNVSDIFSRQGQEVKEL